MKYSNFFFLNSKPPPPPRIMGRYFFRLNHSVLHQIQSTKSPKEKTKTDFTTLPCYL